PIGMSPMIGNDQKMPGATARCCCWPVSQAAQASTGPSWALPEPVVPPPAIAAPRDVAYPGTIRLEVDTTDVARGIHRIHETVPVKGARHSTLLYPSGFPAI